MPIQVFKQRFEELGIKTVYNTNYPPETANFDTLASAIAQAKPDLVVHGAVAADGVAASAGEECHDK